METTTVSPSISYIIDNFDDPYLITHVTSEQNFHGDFHIHNGFYEFYLFVDGIGFYYNDGIKYPLRPGDFIIIAPEKIHRAYISNSHTYERIVLHLSAKTLMELSSPVTNLLHDCQNCSNRFYHFEKEELKKQIHLTEPLISLDEESQRHGIDLLQRSYLTILLLETFESIKKFSPGVLLPVPPVIQNALDYINLYLSDDISIQSIADALNISRSYLCHQFRDYFNTSLWNYILSKGLFLLKVSYFAGKRSRRLATNQVSEIMHILSKPFPERLESLQKNIAKIPKKIKLFCFQAKKGLLHRKLCSSPFSSAF